MEGILCSTATCNLRNVHETTSEVALEYRACPLLLNSLTFNLSYLATMCVNAIKL